MKRKAAVPDSQANPAVNRPPVAPALRTVFNILTAWQVKVKYWGVLLGVSQPTVQRWKASPNDVAKINSRDLAERLSYILGIYKALQILLPDPHSADTWMQRPNSAALFAGHTPLQRILGGNVSDLYEVRRWLDGQRGTA